MTHDARLREEVRSYYDTVSRYIEVELVRRDDREFWKRIARRTARPSILDLGCGTGRITDVLSREAARVVGIDLSRTMLRRARERLEGRRHVHLVVADMRSLRLACSFELIVAANDPFVHLVKDEDRDRAMETVVEHLDPDGGRFVLDAFWLGEERLAQAARPDGYQRERTLRPDDADDIDTLRIRETWRCDPESRRCRVCYEYIRGTDGERNNAGPDDLDNKDGTKARTSPDRATFHARLWSVEELETRLDRAGLRIEALHGGFDGRSF
ncbi:MAG: class I SAM-dependent methyltransferase, partial [Longimicrobiales bacterium]|nr:class I SAM-dependent methyltransferase [Longimicrobiales bacterium]